jgi:acyl carrier protein
MDKAHRKRGRADVICTPLEERVREMMAAIFDTDIAHITTNTARGELEQWDSLGHLVLILELEQQFGISLPPGEAERLNSVAEIAQVLAADYGVRA